MSKKKMTKEELELEQSKAEKHSAIADRFHTLEKKYKERGHKNRAYLAHRVAAKHAAIAKEAMELLDEYGVQGMKWGVSKEGTPASFQLGSFRKGQHSILKRTTKSLKLATKHAATALKREIVYHTKRGKIWSGGRGGKWVKG